MIAIFYEVFFKCKHFPFHLFLIHYNSCYLDKKVFKYLTTHYISSIIIKNKKEYDNRKYEKFNFTILWKLIFNYIFSFYKKKKLFNLKVIIRNHFRE